MQALIFAVSSAPVVVSPGNAALACSVCFGDPNSLMARGLTAGVIVLAGVIGFVLLFVAGTGLFWIQRGRRSGRVDERVTSGETGT